MGRTTFESSVRSRGGRREDDGVSTGGMLMSVLVSTKLGSGTFPLKIGGNPDEGENVVLPKGSVIVNFQKLSAPDAGASIQIGDADTAIGFMTVVNLGSSLGTSAVITPPNGALATSAGYLANGLAKDTQIFTTNGVTPPTINPVGILTYFVYDDGTSGNR